MSLLPQLHAGCGLPVLDGPDSGELTPFVWTVEQLEPDENPLTLPGIFSRGMRLTVHGVTFTCDRVGVTQWVNDADDGTSSVWVEARFSTDGRHETPVTATRPQLSDDYRGFVLGYKKVQIKPPSFVKGVHSYVDGSGTRVTKDWWFPETVIDMSQFTVEFSTLSISVRLKNLSNDDIFECIRRVRAQVGRMHAIPRLLDSWWVMQPASIVNDKLGEVQIDYVWESDPGNSSPQNPDEQSFVFPPQRWGFYSYKVLPSVTDGGKPSIITVPNFPNRVIDYYDTNGNAVYVDNPYFQPEGWRDLPGRPVG